MAPSWRLMLAAGPRLIFGFLSTPSMQLEPFVDHGVSQQFGLFAVTVYHFSGAFNVFRMNGYDPLVLFIRARTVYRIPLYSIET